MSKTEKKILLSKHKLEKDMNELVKFISSSEHGKKLIELADKRNKLKDEISNISDSIKDTRYNVYLDVCTTNPTLNLRVNTYNNLQDGDYKNRITTVEETIERIIEAPSESLKQKSGWVLGNAMPSRNYKISNRLFRFCRNTLDNLEELFLGR